MDNKNLNKVENAVNEVQWKVDNYADRARDYIQQQRNEFYYRKSKWIL